MRLLQEIEETFALPKPLGLGCHFSSDRRGFSIWNPFAGTYDPDEMVNEC